MTINIFLLLLLGTVASALSNSTISQQTSLDFLPGGRYNPTVRQRTISAGLFTCSSSTPIVKSVCGVVLKEVDKDLITKSLTILRDSVLFNYDDPNHYDLPTGHSCSITAKRRRTKVQAVVTTTDSISLTGDVLNKPLVVALRLPVRVLAQVDVRYRFGTRILFGKCKRYARDSATAHGSLSTTAEGAVAVSLKPSFRQRPDGDYEVSIEPRVALLFDLESTRLHFHLTGQSKFTKFWIAIKGFVAGGLRIVRDLFKGRSLKRTFNGFLDRLKLKAIHVAALTYLDLPSGVRYLLERVLISPLVEREVEKKANHLLDDQEMKLNKQIQKLLKADCNGKRTFVISPSRLEITSDSADSCRQFTPVRRGSGGRRRSGSSRGNGGPRTYSPRRSDGSRTYRPRGSGHPRSSGSSRSSSSSRRNSPRGSGRPQSSGSRRSHRRL